MATEDKFTDSIINATLENLEKEHGWSKELINKVKQLYQSNSLTNLQSLSNAFEEVAISKEAEDND
ncbi:MAG: hypothetical protein ACYDG2_21990 [Ruminiclostridium sp.]